MVDVEIDAFPGIEENHAFLVSMAQLILASPVMERLGGSVSATGTERVGRMRGSESLSTLEMVFAIVGVDAGEVLVIVRLIGVDGDAEVATVAKGSTDDVTFVFACRTIEREHDLVAVGSSIAKTILVLDFDQSVGKREFDELCFAGP